MSEGRSVVLSGDKRDRGCVFKRVARDRPVRLYLTGQLVKYEGKKNGGDHISMLCKRESNLNLLVWLC